jgi:bacteriorhodopsin
VKAVLIGMLFAAGGGVAGLVVVIILFMLNWFDGPGGGMAIVPFVLIPAFGFGYYGLASNLAKRRK